MNKMHDELRLHIGEVYGSEAWEAVTGTIWTNGRPWQLWKLEQDVEHAGSRWRCVIVQRSVYDPDDITALDYAEDIFAEAWEI